jgi:sugar lactone lactonase YvrE
LKSVLHFIKSKIKQFMKKIYLLAVLIVALLFGQRASMAQFVNGQNANVVLGQPNFTSNTQAATVSGMYNPGGVTVDPTTGKVFITDTYNNRVLRFTSVAAAASGSAAEAVLGQPDFTSYTAATTQSGMYYPYGVAVDAFGNLFVVDLRNSRVLRFANAATAANGANAAAVLGQANYTTATFATTQSSMNYPSGVAVDATGNLYVGDENNHRVLRFANAATKPSGANADGVLGQPDFTSSTAATTQSGMFYPAEIAVDAVGTLYVPDYRNHRVLRFANAATKPNGANADGILGQPDFTSSTAATTQSSMNGPFGVAVDATGNLYVAEVSNRRVLRFTNAATKPNGANADGVLGQATFTTATSATTQSGMAGTCSVSVDAAGNLYVADTYNNRVLRFNAVPSVGIPIEGVNPNAHQFRLSQNYPNPFNPSTTIRFAVAQPTQVSLKIYDLMGKEVASLVSGYISAGEHEVVWNAAYLASGVYFYKLQAGSFVQTKKMLLVK